MPLPTFSWPLRLANLRPRSATARAVLGWTGLFLGAYLAIRALPVQKCAFLHYGDYLGADGAVEFCGEEETTFFDLERWRFPVVAEVVPRSRPAVGTEILCDLQLRRSDGTPLGLADLAISHTRPLHLLAVDAGLEDYQHLHPQPTGRPGAWEFALTPRRAGRYRLYLDFITRESARRVVTRSELLVPGGVPTPPVARPEAPFRFHLEDVPATWRSGREETFRLRGETPAGEPVSLEMVMGARAHLVLFDVAGRGFAHLHPLDPPAPDPGPAEVRFRFTPGEPGAYRLWAQVKLAGTEYFHPFDLHVLSP